MFNLFFRPYVPGFRVGARNEVPGFNIDEGGFPRDATGWFDGMLPGAATVTDAVQPAMPRKIRFPIPSPEDSLSVDGWRPGSARPELFDFAEAPTSPPDADGSLEPGSLRLPDWLHNLVSMPLTQ